MNFATSGRAVNHAVELCRPDPRSTFPPPGRSVAFAGIFTTVNAVEFADAVVAVHVPHEDRMLRRDGVEVPIVRFPFAGCCRNWTRAPICRPGVLAAIALIWARASARVLNCSYPMPGDTRGSTPKDV